MRAPRALLAPILVPYDVTLQRGVLIDRRDRFVATIRLDSPLNPVVDAHCVNPGRMEAFVDPGATVWVTRAPEGSTRKLKYSWEAIERADAINGEPIMCGANTQRPNLLMRAVLEARILAGLEDWTTLKAEPAFTVTLADGTVHSGRSDFKLTSGDGAQQHFVEVKNCHLVYSDGWAYFPDSVSERATRHCDSLAALVAQGHRATVCFLVQRSDVVHGVRPSAFHDPTFAAAARRAAAAGVAFRALRAAVGLDGTQITHELPVDLTGSDEPHVVEAVRGWWTANRESTGWTRSQSGRRVANGPFAHHAAPTKTPKTPKKTSRYFHGDEVPPQAVPAQTTGRKKPKKL